MSGEEFKLLVNSRLDRNARITRRLMRFMVVLIIGSIIAVPASSQQPRPGPSRKPPAERASQDSAATFDALLATDTYRIYGEVRGVGSLIRSTGVNDVVDPLLKLTAPPKQLTAMVKWLETHTEALMTSRMLVAFWPLKPKLPQVLIAIEFSSAQEAQKFVPQLREFLPQIWPTSTPESASDEERKTTAQKDKKPPAPPFQIRRSGSLVLLTDSPVTLRNLRPLGSRPLAEDPNFRTARDRFSSESIFLYVAVAADDTNNPKVAGLAPQVVVPGTPEVATEGPSSDPVLPPPPSPTPDLPSEVPQQEPQFQPPDPSAPATNRPEPQLDLRLGILATGFFGGQPEWPEAVGLGLSFDGASYVVRLLLVNSPHTKVRAIPFIPQLISGPALTPESPSVLSADTELFVAASVDFPQIYEGMLKAFQATRTSGDPIQPVDATEPESPFASFEKEFGISIEEELLPLLGNEVALSMPLTPVAVPTPSPTDGGQQPNEATKPPPPSGPNPVFAIAIKDREAVRGLIAKMMDSAGLKGAHLLAQTDRRDDSELISFANMFSYAFIGNFLVFSADPAGTKHVVDSYRANKTLTSEGNFKNYSRWQPRQVLGQVHVAPSAAKNYTSMPSDLTVVMNEDLNDFLSRLSPIAEPITYALSNEGMGPLHEIHFPKNFVMMFIAGLSSDLTQPPLVTNEAATRGALLSIASAQANYQATKGDGQYANLEELINEGLVDRNVVDNFGYTVNVTTSGKAFAVTAIPNEYGKTGNTSFFIDESGVLRGGDRAGGPATIADKPLN